MTHQEGIAHAITALLNLPPEAFKALKVGNPLDKMIRSYREFTEDHQPLYRHLRAIHFLKATREAREEGSLYAEHVVPVSVTIERLISIADRAKGEERRVEPEEVAAALSDAEVILVSDREQIELNKVLKSRCADDEDTKGVRRLKRVGIEVEELLPPILTLFIPSKNHKKMLKT